MSTDCVGVLLLNENVEFLEFFAQWSLQGRLLIWTAKLIVITSLQLSVLQSLVSTHWIYSNMNTVVLNQVYKANSANFFGAQVNVSATSYKPLWFETTVETRDGQTEKRITGMDYLLLTAVARALNFTFYVVPIKSWSEALNHMEKRQTFATPVYHVVLYNRLKRFEYTLGYTYSRLSFSMAKPKLTPNWQSLYNPLSDEVWITIFASVVFVIVVLMVFQKIVMYINEDEDTFNDWITQLVVASLFSQSASAHLPKSNSIRIILAVWLIFTFIIGVAYRGNLTAFLTLPKYPPRPETIPELVSNAERVNWDSWGKDFKLYFRDSGSEVFEKLAGLIEVGIETVEGLKYVTKSRQAYMDTIHKLRLDIAEHFTNVDGSSPLYIGRESVMPGLAAWPIPHDSPYKTQLDRCISRVVEGGLYEKWTDDMMDLARQYSVKRKKLFQETRSKENDVEEGTASEGQGIQALTLTHLQGPLILLVLGTALAAVTFLIEFVVIKC
ncbi:hypothetical protein SK128_001425 [Halocaridina rubra]|uniref:Ionotropic glutamate receptor C-terminal domain-containing protein n=1 Tax=Halocaridina rubra TaxID=373956 RepID=A0AAN8XS71_HALRR